MKIIKINEHSKELSVFLDIAGDSLQTFRYFSKRDKSVLRNHLITLLFLVEDKPVCYGHLDQAEDKVWLGICVIASERGKGYGDKMMTELLDFADLQGLSHVSLAVDSNNKTAKKLYEKHGFVQFTNDTKLSYYKRSLS